MGFFEIFMTMYIGTTIIALVMTYREQKRRRLKTPLFTFMGYLLCMVWPLVAAVMVLFYRSDSA